MVWKPHVTVAAVIEKQGRFLLVEEETKKGLAFNQPAGHLENGESIIHAVKREVCEETAWQFEPESIIAVQLWQKGTSASFLRFCFTGQISDFNPNQALDTGIIQTHWLSHDEVMAKNSQLRSPLVLNSIDDYLQGNHYPLTLLSAYINHA